MYYIGTDNTFITIDKNGKAVTTMKFSDAKLFQNKQKAGQFLVSLPRTLYNISNKWSVKECPQTKSDKSSGTHYNQPDINRQQVDYLALLDSVSILKESKKDCLTNLNSKLSTISQEIVDLEHYIEFSKLNACDAYKAYKMLRDALKERRKIKDNIAAAQSLYDNCNIEKISSCNDKLHNRIYSPRKLKSLFD